jgi:hypothetical protein
MKMTSTGFECKINSELFETKESHVTPVKSGLVLKPGL